jgi:Tfp pilus assembly protein PilX
MTMMDRWKRKWRQRGSGLIVVMVLLTVMAIYLATNSTQLDRLRRTLDRVEKQQIERIQPPAPKTPPKAEADKAPR